MLPAPHHFNKIAAGNPPRHPGNAAAGVAPLKRAGGHTGRAIDKAHYFEGYAVPPGTSID